MADLDKLKELKELGTIRKYNDDDFIFYEGQPGNEMFIILTGKVEVFLNSFGNFPIKLTEMGPGEFFGEMAILDDQPRSASVVASGSTIVITITKASFEEFISKQPSMAYKIMKTLSTRIRRLNADLCKTREGSGDTVFADSSETSGTDGLQKDTGSVRGEDAGVIQTKDSIFPPGHKKYSGIASATHNEFLFDKKVKCPLCGAGLTVKMQRLSKLKLKNIDNDFRHKYTDFEPLWYSIWVCSQCSYANFSYEFDSLSDKGIKLLTEKAADLKLKMPVKLSFPMDINQVFASYYMAIYCAVIYKAPSQKLAKLWMQLSWLYNDVNDREMFMTASSYAYDNYHNAFYNCNLNITTEQEQQYHIILGELLLLKGDEKEALNHFYAAMKKNTGKAALSQQAQSRIQEVKSANKQ